MKQRLYWSPSIGKELAFKNEADYAQAFQEIFFKAVGDRIQSPHPISVLLSGGLDSSGIVAVAAKILEKQNRELHTFSAVLPDAHDAVFRDERYFINQFRSFPNVKINYVTAPNQGFFSTLTTSQPAWESPRRTSRYYLYEAFNREVAQIGSKVILEGVFGELGATFYGSGAYAEMFLRGQWFGLWREFNARKKTVGASVARSFLAQVVRPLLSPYLNVYRNDEYNFFRVADHHCLQPDFADYLYTMVLPRREELKPYMNPLRPNHRENQFNAIKFLHHKDYSSPHLGENIYRYPFKDKRLLEFCLNLPLDLKVKNGYNRYSIRAGLDKILPPEIQWRTTKQPFSPDYMRRYKQQQPQVLAYLEDIRANDPVRTLIDVEKLKKWAKMPVAENEQRKDVITIAMHGLPDGIYLIHFLRRFSDFKVN